MSHQFQAPPTPEEEHLIERTQSGPRSFETWPGNYGWCSACLVDDQRVVYFGTRERFVAICGFCLAKLADTLRATPPESEDT